LFLLICLLFKPCARAQYPGGVEKQKLLLEKEGHTIIKKGKRLFVKDYEDFCQKCETASA